MSQIDNERLRSIVERIENVNEEIDGLTQDRRDILTEAKSAGFDTKAINHIVKLRKKSKEEREEQQNIFAIYEHALGL